MNAKPPSKGENTRRKLIQTSIDLISQNGFGETSFQMIADECGLSQSAVLHHFKTKNQLVGEILQTIVENNHRLVAEMIAPEDDAFQRLMKHCLGNVMWAQKNRKDAQIIVLLYHLAAFDPDFSARYAEITKTGRARIREHVLAGQREKIFRFKGDPNELTETLHNAVVGSLVDVVAGSSRPGHSATSNKAKWEMMISALAGYKEMV